MLPAQYRLKKRKSFNYLYRQGQHANGQYVTLFFCRASALKIGFSASKKVGNSVVRHRAVRLLREAVRPLLGQINPQTNLIIAAKPDCPKQHLLFLTLDLQKALKSAGLML